MTVRLFCLDRGEFDRLISWVPTDDAPIEW